MEVMMNLQGKLRASIVVLGLVAVPLSAPSAQPAAPPDPGAPAPVDAPPPAADPTPPPPPAAVVVVPPSAGAPTPPPAAGPPAFKIDGGTGNSLKVGLLVQPAF